MRGEWRWEMLQVISGGVSQCGFPEALGVVWFFKKIPRRIACGSSCRACMAWDAMPGLAGWKASAEQWREMVAMICGRPVSFSAYVGGRAGWDGTGRDGTGFEVGVVCGEPRWKWRWQWKRRGVGVDGSDVLVARLA